ncbi:hypothetical protein M9Y10_032436 [Tritrichomonas musculus]|uniref:Uncharacterized protein n=1 Tax=Tritrichomonas musculus TaxID=1915356 RepID=A0ABR2GYK8_9EUKA
MNSIDMTFKIDKANKTASLFRVHKNHDQVIIPRTVEHERTDYLITSISGINTSIKIIKFEEDSAMKTFYRNAFQSSQIEEIHFPASLNELEEDWCFGTDKLKKNCYFTVE